MFFYYFSILRSVKENYKNNCIFIDEKIKNEFVMATIYIYIIYNLL